MESPRHFETRARVAAASRRDARGANARRKSRANARRAMGTLSRARARAVASRRDNTAVEAAARLDVKPTRERAWTAEDSSEDARARALAVQHARAAHALTEDEERGRGTRARVGGEGDDARGGDDDDWTCATCRATYGRGETSVSDGSWTTCAVRRGRARGRAMLVARGDVFDATEFLKTHPSGPAPILRAMARDNTEDLEMHSSRARGIWERFRVGKLTPCGEGGYGEFQPPPTLPLGCAIT